MTDDQPCIFPISDNSSAIFIPDLRVSHDPIRESCQKVESSLHDPYESPVELPEFPDSDSSVVAESKPLHLFYGFDFAPGKGIRTEDREGSDWWRKDTRINGMLDGVIRRLGGMTTVVPVNRSGTGV